MSLAFANFAEGYPDSQLDADLMVRMFGDQVCQTAASPCELTPAARAFAKRANRSMSGGRCEGFAVLASLFEAGQLDPVDFDGASARELTLEGNTRLQRELTELGLHAMAHGTGKLLELESELAEVLGRTQLRALHAALSKLLPVLEEGAAGLVAAPAPARPPPRSSGSRRRTPTSSPSRPG